MTNYEKYKDQIDWQARAGSSLAVRKSDNTPIMCEEIDCSECKFYQRGNTCGLQAIEWLKAEYEEPEVEVDWNKVPIDTPILVKTGINDEWTERFFAGYIADKVCVFDGYDTSENFVGISPWNYAKLAKKEEKE